MDNHDNSSSSDQSDKPSVMERFQKLEERILANGTAKEKASLEKAREIIRRLNKNKVSNDQFHSFMLDNHFTNMMKILEIQCSPADIIVRGSVFKTLDKLFGLVVDAVPIVLSKIKQQFDENKLTSLFEIMQKYGEYDMLTCSQKTNLKKIILEGCRTICTTHKSKWSRDLAKQLSSVLSALRNGSRDDAEVEFDTNMFLDKNE